MSWDSRPLIIGHRGAAGLEPENTLASFRRAVDLGVGAVELDVHFHAGELWVIHDELLDRTTNAEGPLNRLTAEELAAVDAGGGQRIPRLEEVLAEIPPSVGVNIELKGSGTAEPVARVLAGRASPECLVSSFDHEELWRFIDAVREPCRVAPLFNRWQRGVWVTASRMKAWSINLNARLATPGRVARAQSMGVRVLVYTVNDADQARRLLAMCVAGLFTDRPDVIAPAGPDGRSPGTDRSGDR